MASGLPCTVIIDNEDFIDQAPAPEQLRHIITSDPSLATKRQALESLIRMMLSDPSYDRLLLPVLKHLSPVNDHAIKKLLFIYWEVVEKTSPEGKFKEEVLLCAEPLRKDLTHPNEFIRGRTLRLIARIPHLDLVEPLIPSIMDCLEHRYHYVRRNAVTCLFSLYTQFGADLLRSSAQPVQKLLSKEGDLSTRRNAFIYLFCIDQSRALRFLWTLVSNRSIDDPLAQMGGDIFQLSIIELIRKLCRADPSQKPHFLKLLQLFGMSKSAAVLLECADTLVQLSPLAHDVRLAIDSYVALLLDQTDNNVRLIVLTKLKALRETHQKLLEESVVDLLGLIRGATSESFEQRESMIELICSLANARNAKEIQEALIHELVRSASQQEEWSAQYRALLVKQIRKHSLRFGTELIMQAISPMVQHILSQEKTKKNKKNKKNTAEIAISFIKEAMLLNDTCRHHALLQVANALGNAEIARNREVLRQVMWLLGEYSQNEEQIEEVLDSILQALEPLPLTKSVPQDGANTRKESDQKVIMKTVIKEDGSYGTEAVKQTHEKAGISNKEQNPLRKLLTSEIPDALLGGISGVSLTKLILKKKKRDPKYDLKVILVLCSLVKLLSTLKEKSSLAAKDNKERILFCLKLVAVVQKNPDTSGAALKQIYHQFTDSSFSILKEAAPEQTNEEVLDRQEEKLILQPDVPLNFRQLQRVPVSSSPQAFIASIVGLSSELMAAPSLSGNIASSSPYDEELGNVSLSTFKGGSEEQKSQIDGFPLFHSFTGQSDPVFAQARLYHGKFALVLEITVINTTQRIIQDAQLELFALGDAKVADRIHPQTLAPGESYIRRVSVKVERAERMIVYGFVTYTGTRGGPPIVLVLNDLMLNLADRLGAIQGEVLPPQTFKEKWQIYTWEKKQPIEKNLEAQGLDNVFQTYIETISSELGLAVVETQGAGAFIVANLFGKSPYDDECLLNLSLRSVVVKSTNEVHLRGHVRVRSNKQALCEAIADKIRALSNN